MGVNIQGTKEVLGLWIEANEGAKFWLKIMTELKNRGVADMLLVCCDGLKGFPEAIEAAFPRSTVQTCMVHRSELEMRFVAWEDRKPVVNALARSNRRRHRDAAEALTAFGGAWVSAIR